MDDEKKCTAGREKILLRGIQPEKDEPYETPLDTSNNSRFVSEVEFTARKILQDCNQRRKKEALLFANKAKVKRVKDQKRFSRDANSKVIVHTESGHVLPSKPKTPQTNSLDANKDSHRQDILRKQEILLPSVQQTIMRSLPRPPPSSKNGRRLPSWEGLPPPTAPEAPTLASMVAKDIEKSKKTMNIIQELQNSPFFTRNMLVSATRSLQERNGGKARGRKKRSKDSIQSQDWTSYPLKAKYRYDDNCRFICSSAARESDLSHHSMPNVDTTELALHPLERQLQQQILAAYDRSREDIQTCLRLHHFITNLHESWTSNVESLGIFQTEAPLSPLCDNSLRDRRDIAALCKKKSQIQSISLERACRKFRIQETTEEHGFTFKSFTWHERNTPIKPRTPSFFICDDATIKWNDTTAPSLTIRAADPTFILSQTLCPGCTYFGERGITWDTIAKSPHIGDGTCMALPDTDLTQATIFLSRAGPDLCSPITVTISMALERPLVACHFVAIDSTIFAPEVTYSEIERLPIPTTMAEPSEKLCIPFETRIDSVLPHTIMILNSAADKADWCTKSEDCALNTEGSNCKKYFAKHRRDMHEFTDQGFRCKELTEPRTLNKIIKTTVIGISEQALETNISSLCQPILHHCKEYITVENLTRKRTHADFRYVLQDPYRNKAGGSLPETSIFKIHMKAYSVQLVERIYAKDLRNTHQQEQRMGVEKQLNGMPLLEQNRRMQKMETICKEGVAEKIGAIDIPKCDTTVWAQVNPCRAGLSPKLIEMSRKQGLETLIGADFLEPRILKLDEASAGIFRGADHVTRIVVGVEKPHTYAMIESDFSYPQHINTVFIEDIQEDLERYHPQSTLDNGDGAATAVTTSTRSDMDSLFTNAMLLVRSSPIDYEALENLLDTFDDRAFDINHRDKYGNTLLLLACQQGGISKRISKLLLRRGADINAQNYMGNTALHYLMTYNQSPVLAEYMIQRGADDSLLNYDGLTCYEGLSKEDVDDME